MPDKKSPIRPKPKRHRKKRHPRRAGRDVPPGFVLPAYLTDPDISIDRLSRWLVKDTEAREPAEAYELLRVALARIGPGLREMLQTEDLQLASRAIRIFNRLQRAHDKVVFRLAMKYPSFRNALLKARDSARRDRQGACRESGNE